MKNSDTTQGMRDRVSELVDKIYTVGGVSVSNTLDKMILSHVQSEVALSVSEERERIVKIFENERASFSLRGVPVDDIISAIGGERV